MNIHKASALKRFEGQIKRLFGLKSLTIATRYTRHGATRNDRNKPSGAARRRAWADRPYRRNAKGVWCLRLQPQTDRVPRGNPNNPTTL